MRAFRALEARLLDLTLFGRQDAAEPAVVLGLFTEEPDELHDGDYGHSGEPEKSVTPLSPGSYRRPVVKFKTEVDSVGTTQAVNVSTITVTGLPPGTYTHFGLFGDKAGA